MIATGMETAAPGLGGLIEAIQQRGASGATLVVRLRNGGGWEVKNPAEQPTVNVTQADMDMAIRGCAIGSDLRREWQMALLFAEHREAALGGSGATAAPARRVRRLRRSAREEAPCRRRRG